MSAVLRDTHGRLTVRLNNAAAHATTARLTRDGERAAGTVVDLVGGARGHWSSEHPLAPWEIATLQLDQPR